jgi:hypothetical protein
MRVHALACIHILLNDGANRCFVALRIQQSGRDEDQR